MLGDDVLEHLDVEHRQHLAEPVLAVPVGEERVDHGVWPATSDETRSRCTARGGGHFGEDLGEDAEQTLRERRVGLRLRDQGVEEMT